ncbi:hypothetical protein [Phenylobacterium sp.]|uniref:hypothetical protein n=1 Tax=Phenylobacterium sp. TaxID=1871053 RepID=UPI0011FE8214|nr:hypothetical protein [Phenylobacterium sp.]TAL36967.1 MAG: hypothetical protein EPN98_04115 [Phenylobacterium sp.]
MSRIDRIRHAALVRRANRAEADRAEDTHGAGEANMPVAVTPAASPRTFKDDPRQGYSEVAAQLMGQHGERRGLRAGPGLFGLARDAYNSIEWSGSYDRRARKGRQARTEI